MAGHAAFTLMSTAPSIFIPDKCLIIHFGHKAQVLKIFLDTKSATQQAPFLQLHAIQNDGHVSCQLHQGSGPQCSKAALTEPF